MKLDETRILIREADLDSIIQRLESIMKFLEENGNRKESQKKISLSTEEASAYLNVSRTEIYRLTKSGKLSYSKVGGRRRFSIPELDKYLEGIHFSSLDSIF